jgi:hypothetical protein
MPSHRLLFTAALFAAVSVFGQVPARVRGTILASDSSSITVRQRDGRTFMLKTGADTTYRDVLPSSLDAIRVNDYIGTAVKGSLNHWIAVEIVLVPDSMRVGRIGYYPWDPLLDTSGVPTSRTTATAMTSGIVSSAPPEFTNTDMTNGVVTAVESSERGKTLTVALVGNMPAHIFVSAAAPVVRFVPSDRSVILVGAAVVVWTNQDNTARLANVIRNHNYNKGIYSLSDRCGTLRGRIRETLCRGRGVFGARCRCWCGPWRRCGRSLSFWPSRWLSDLIRSRGLGKEWQATL